MASVNNMEAQPVAGRAEAAEKERRDQLRHLEKELFQLAYYYFVFQGVIFTAFYRAPPHLKCGYKWVPITLSALAGVLNCFALLRIALRYKSTLDEGHNEEARNCIAVKCERWWRCFYVVGCMLAVIAFLIVTLAGCWVITCDSDNSSAAAPHGG